MARVNPITRMAGRGEGDVYGSVVESVLDGKESLALELSELVAKEEFQETDRIKFFEMESPLLSKFFGFSYKIRAGVMLPKEYDPSKKYPVVYDIPGFGGTHKGIRRMPMRLAKDSYLQKCIVVIPDPSNRYGHSVFCNSRSIGPRGDALVKELIPALGKEVRWCWGQTSVCDGREFGWLVMPLFAVDVSERVCRLLESCSRSNRFSRLPTNQSVRSDAQWRATQYVHRRKGGASTFGASGHPSHVDL